MLQVVLPWCQWDYLLQMLMVIITAKWITMSLCTLQHIEQLIQCFLCARNCAKHCISIVSFKIKLSIQMCLVAQSCLTLCDSMDCSPPGSSVHGDSLGKNTGMGCHALLQGIFTTHEFNLSLLHRRHSLLSEPPRSLLNEI